MAVQGAQAMATFVLIPGGWRGGWTFADFVARLKRAGHAAFAVTLSGLDPATNQPAGAINLDTHIADVLELLTVEDLAEVILCAHSYGGMVATGAAARAPERIAALAYLDAFVPEDGQSWWELAGEYFRKLAIERARHDGLTVLPPDGRDPRCRPHPLASFLQALHLGEAATPGKRVFVYASGWEATPFAAQYQRLQQDPTWIVHSIACGHDVINIAPDEVFDILMETARMGGS
jgi:pimeloyl-ACP methyl ester carboxylesterase